MLNFCSRHGCFGKINSYTGKCATCHKPRLSSRTQKSRGILTMKEFYNEFSSLSIVSIYDILTSIHEVDSVSDYLLPLFARPAPSDPKHGYIDSRIITSKDDIKALLSEVLTDDPNGELILCSIINASCSGVWTPTSLVIGPSNNGATQGIDAVTIPLNGINPISKKVLNAAGIKDHPYIEVVYTSTNNDPILTQLRNGPILPSFTGDYIPFPVIVQTVIKADPIKFKDRGWELEMDSVKGQPGIVVWHPGGAMSDHFSIHAFLAGFPIIFGETAPVVGDILEPNESGPIQFDPSMMLRGIIAGESVDLCTSQNELKNYAKSGLIALHNSASMTGENSKWLGFGAAILLRLGIAALNGEARHFDSLNSVSRETIYEKSLSKSLSYHKARLNRLINIFRYGRWSSAGFGGPKWAMCGAAVLDVVNAMSDLAAQQSSQSAAAVVSALNIMVNQAHNGGWWFNKFLPEGTFTSIAGGCINETIHVGPAFFEGNKLIESISQSAYEKKVAIMAKWGRTTLNPPRISSASVLLSNNMSSLELKIVSRVLKNKFKPIYTPVPPFLGDKPLADIKKNLCLSETDDGYSLEYGKTEPKVVWMDESLRDLTIKTANNKTIKGA